jgi:hypothetical protein
LPLRYQDAQYSTANRFVHSELLTGYIVRAERNIARQSCGSRLGTLTGIQQAQWSKLISLVADVNWISACCRQG